MLVNFSNGFIYASNRNVFILSIITCMGLIVCGTFILIDYPKTLSNTATLEGTFVEIDTIEHAIKVRGERCWYDYKYKVQDAYKFAEEDLPNVREFMANNKTDNISVRIWAEKWQARQIELNGVIVKEYNWWEYAQPALWLMILPGTIILILLILDRKRLLNEPEQEKSEQIR